MDYRSIGMGLAFAVMWSSAFSSARVIVAYASPLAALSVRFLISGLLGVLIAWILKQSLPQTRTQWRAVLLFGLCQNAIYLGLNFVATQWLEASLTAIIASTMPLVVALGNWLVFRQQPRPLALVGLLVGMIGVALIMGTRLSGGSDLLGIGLCVIAVLSLSVATMTLRSASAGGNVLMIVGLQMLVGSAGLAVAALLFEDISVTPSWQLAVAFTYTTLVPGLVATLIWFLLVERIGTVEAAVFHFLTPFFGVTIAALLLGEKLGFLDLIGVGVITLGILAVQLSKRGTVQSRQ